MKASKRLTQKRLKELLHYDPLTGVWTWLETMNHMSKVGTIAGCIDDGYRRITIDQKTYKSSRLAFLYIEGYSPENEVDHINRVRHDDRWSNLRHVNKKCNARNCNLRKDNNSGVKGVCWNKDREIWRAFIAVDQRQCSLGSHRDFNEAVLHRLCAEQCLAWSGCDSESPAYQYAINNNLIRRPA